MTVRILWGTGCVEGRGAPLLQVGILQVQPETWRCTERCGELYSGFSSDHLAAVDDIRDERCGAVDDVGEVCVTPAALIQFVGKLLTGREVLGQGALDHSSILSGSVTGSWLTELPEAIACPSSVCSPTDPTFTV